MTEEEWLSYLLKHRGYHQAASKLWHLLKTLNQYEGILTIAALLSAVAERKTHVRHPNKATKRQDMEA